MAGRTSPPQTDGNTAPARTTAGRMGKRYETAFAPSDEADKSPCRTVDGPLSSGAYARGNDRLADALTPDALRIDYHHALEGILGRRPVRWLLRRLTRRTRTGRTPLETILHAYRNPAAPAWVKLLSWPIHAMIARLTGGMDGESFRAKLVDRRDVLRGLILTSRSIGEFGLSVPQKFSAPLFAVWNFTNRCNLRCRHCYQDSDPNALAGELTREEKLDLVDQMGRAHTPMLALSGGEPTVHEDLLPVVRRAAGWGMHLSLATNGTTMTESLAGHLAEAGMRYVEISLDSTEPTRHDAFRGAPGLWKRSVDGARVVAATEGLRLGIAMCVHRENVDEVEDMIRLAEDLGADCFAHFNFIPVGRGLEMIDSDISPARRERLLALLNEKMQDNRIGVISTAPQLGRVCLAGAALETGRATCSHAGSGSGVKARVVAKYLGGCGAGRTYVCIEPDGNITPCVYLPHRVMGNVRRKPLGEIFRDSELWDLLNDRRRRQGHCEVCTFKAYCGGCRARADAYFGRLHAGDPGCVFNAHHWDRLVAESPCRIEPNAAD